MSGTAPIQQSFVLDTEPMHVLEDYNRHSVMIGEPHSLRPRMCVPPIHDPTPRVGRMALSNGPLVASAVAHLRIRII